MFYCAFYLFRAFVKMSREEIKEKGLDEPHNENPWKTKTKENQRRTSSMNGQDQRFKCKKCSFTYQNRIDLCKYIIKEHSSNEEFNFIESKLQRIFS